MTHLQRSCTPTGARRPDQPDVTGRLGRQRVALAAYASCRGGPAYAWLVGTDLGTGPSDIVVHIGAPKTGTTYMQDRLNQRRAELLRLGVLYPDTPWLNHVQHLLGPLRWFANDATQQAQADQLWDGLLTAVRAHHGRCVVSAENAVIANPAMISQIVNDLGPDRVQVLLTVRPVANVLSSFWQEEVRWGATDTFETWLAGALQALDGPSLHPLWACHDHAAIAQRWSEVVGPDRVTVVIAQPDRPATVTDIVEQLLVLPGGTLAHPDADTARANRSLTMAEVELIRRLNVSRSGPQGVPQMGEVLTLATIERLVEGRRPGPDEPRPQPPRSVVQTLEPFSRQSVTRLQALGVHVVGDPETLVADPLRFDEAGYTSHDRSDHLRLDSAVLLIEHLLQDRDDRGQSSG